MRFALAAAFVTGLLFAGCGSQPETRTRALPPVAKKALTDPVCGMALAGKTAWIGDFDQSDYFFCSEACLQKFKAEPTKYVKACRCAPPRGKACHCAHCLGERVPCDCVTFD